jgi:hypothetical protein
VVLPLWRARLKIGRPTREFHDALRHLVSCTAAFAAWLIFINQIFLTTRAVKARDRGVAAAASDDSCRRLLLTQRGLRGELVKCSSALSLRVMRASVSLAIGAGPAVGSS